MVKAILRSLAHPFIVISVVLLLTIALSLIAFGSYGEAEEGYYSLGSYGDGFLFGLQMGAIALIPFWCVFGPIMLFFRPKDNKAYDVAEVIALIFALIFGNFLGAFLSVLITAT